MSIYYTKPTDKYVISWNKTDNAYYAECNEILVNGEKKLLHNEIMFSFIFVNGEIKVISGSHIGTEDFDFDENDGDDCNYYVENYHPGLLAQLKKEIENMNNTSLVCPVCGTKMELPEHSSVCLGQTLAKDSNAGTVYLTPEKENSKMNKAEERMSKLAAAGVDVSKFMVLTGSNGEGFLFKNENGIPTPVLDDDPILNEIKEGGYVFNRFVDARWIPAQMFHMLNFKGYRGTGTGYDAALTAKGYEYQFTFIAEELHRLAKKERQGDKTLETRGLFFTQDIVYAVLLDYVEKLKKYIDHLPTFGCKGVPYKRILGFKHGNNGFGDVFVVDIAKKVIRPINSSIWKFNPSYSYKRMTFAQLEREFNNWMKNYYIPFRKYSKFKQANVFRDTYKGLGAYETCNSLIKFHNCYVHDEYGKLDTDRSLAVLNAKAKEYKGEYWRLFAFMKKLIADNNFTPDWK